MIDFIKNRKLVALALLLVFTISLTGGIASCAKVQAADLMQGISAANVSGKETDEKFISNVSDFSFNLFKTSLTSGKNSLVSPLSVMLALAMTANGAAGNTLEQMRQTLAKDISPDDLNEYLYTYVKNLPNADAAKIKIANSIWFKDAADKFEPENTFLQKNADYYNASAYKVPFNKQTVIEINDWVKNKTDGLIDKILDSVPDETLMVLINALVFDAKWEKEYDKRQVNKENFTTINDEIKSVDMMTSEEKFYIEDENSIGFIKPYKNDSYSFVAMLPKPGVTFGNFVISLTGEKFIKMIDGSVEKKVLAKLPKFTYDYEVYMASQLKGLGMSDAFSPEKADFSKLGKSAMGNIYIAEVIHKTFISVDELGTRAGAVTAVIMVGTAMPEYTYVTLDRPFVYAIIDNATNLPVFIGTVVDFD